MWKISFGPDDDLGENRVLKMVFNYGINGITCNFFEHDTYTSNYMSFSEFPYLQNYGTYFSCLDPYNSSCFIVGGRAFNPASESTYLLPWSAFPSDALDCTAINTWQDTLANEVSNSKISFLGSDSSGLGYFCRTIYPDMMLRDSTKTYFTAAGDEIDIPQNYMDALESVNLLDNKFLLTLKGADGKTYFTLLDLADGSTFAPVLHKLSHKTVLYLQSVLPANLSGFTALKTERNWIHLISLNRTATELMTFSLVVTILSFAAMMTAMRIFSIMYTL